MATSDSFAPAPLEQARTMTDKVQRDLEIATAELGLAHDALDRHIPPAEREEDVAWAIDQNAAVEQKLEVATEELEEVTGLLQQEAAERARLERALAARGG
ncbi:MAG: hypothetical protein V4864_12550 [Pseudomonadota bacterium]